MKNFNELQIGDIVYALNSQAKIEVCKIEGVIPRHFGTKGLNGKIYGYDILLSFNNDKKLYKTFIESRLMEQNIKQTKIYNASDGTYKNKDFPYYLIGINQKSLIEYYIKRLEESIEYQKEVISTGQQKIKQLEVIVKKYKQNLESYATKSN